MVVGRGQNWIPWKVFYCEFSKNLQNTFFKEKLWKNACESK